MYVSDAASANSAPTRSNAPVPAASRTSTSPTEAIASATHVRAVGTARPSSSDATVTNAGYV